MTDSLEVLERFNEIKSLVESLELDAHKNATGVAAAGLRLRKGMRLIKIRAGDLIKITVERDKTLKRKK